MAFTPIKQEVKIGEKVKSPLTNKTYFTAIENTTVSWCTCDKSQKFPFCDGKHLGI